MHACEAVSYTHLAMDMQAGRRTQSLAQFAAELAGLATRLAAAQTAAPAAGCLLYTSQDDAHIFMTPEQIKDEIKGVVKLIDQVYSLFGFEYHIVDFPEPDEPMMETNSPF